MKAQKDAELGEEPGHLLWLDQSRELKDFVGELVVSQVRGTVNKTILRRYR